jgi:RHS repeat-associated protein
LFGRGLQKTTPTKATEAMFRRYNRWHSRFDQPDPYDGSYDQTDQQSFNRYAYVKGDPVNFVDPSGLMMVLASVMWDYGSNSWIGIYGSDFQLSPGDSEFGPDSTEGRRYLGGGYRIGSR